MAGFQRVEAVMGWEVKEGTVHIRATLLRNLAKEGRRGQCARRRYRVKFLVHFLLCCRARKDWDMFTGKRSQWRGGGGRCEER